MNTAIRQQFQQYFKNSFRVATAPGRVNLIGEHTDYNQGFVLPAAIDRSISVALAPNDSGSMNLRAVQYGEQFSFSVDDVRPVAGWASYIMGMIYLLMPEKRLPYGMDIVITGDVPVGAGMSSSAALCSALGVALNEIFQLGLSRMELALAGQQTEHQFAGLQCGIMDQFASLHGKPGQLMKLDCRSMDFEYIPFDFPDIRIVLVNSMVSHSLASSEYNLRRQQCEEGVRLLQQYDPAIQSLRDVTREMLQTHQSELSDTVYRRCRFIIGENQRLAEGCVHLKNHDLDAFGKLMYVAHEGLSKDYEVSCAESDFLVHAMKDMKAVKGARQMGGGFGGCIITLVKKNDAENLIQGIRQKYKSQFGKTPDCYMMQIGDGAHMIM